MINSRTKTSRRFHRFNQCPYWMNNLWLLCVLCASVVILISGCLTTDNNSSSGSSTSIIPTAPSKLIGTAISSTAITISWTDTTTTELGFYVERRTPPSTVWTVLPVTPTANTISYTDTGLTVNTTYYYRVKAFNFVGQSGYSNEAGTLTSWNTTDTTTAPSERIQHTAVWADNIGMITWGGWNDTGGYITSGGVYSPTATVSWTATAAAPGSMRGRIGHTAIWTGSEMIIWGGHWYNAISATNVYLYDGGIYDPALNNWTPITSTVSPISRTGHAAVWTGEWMVACGGYDNTYLKSMAALAPSGPAWVYFLPDMDTARRWHTAIWTGSGSDETWRHQIIIWGGYNGSYLNTGQAYHMETGQYQTIPITNAPTARCNHTVVWTGSKMIVWGGYNGTYLNTGGIYDPATNTWSPISTINAPSARMDHTTIWTGSKMIVWGGGLAPGINSGGMYDPQTDIWTPLSTINSPAPRGQHTAVWTGTEMIIWGGWNGVDIFKTGGLYKIE